MHPTALALVSAAAVSHAVWNLYIKRAADGGVALIWLGTSLSVVFYAPLVLVTIILSPPQWSWILPLLMLATSVLHVSDILLLQRGYQQGDMSVVYPLARGTGPILAVTFAIVVFGERPGLAGMLGAGAVLAGIMLIAVSRPSGTARLSAGVGYGLTIGVLIASYTVFDAWVVGPLAFAPILYDWGNNFFRVVLMSPFALRQPGKVAQVWRDHRSAVLTLAVLSPASYILVLFAYRYAPVSLVAPTREISIVIGAILAWMLLRERQALRRICGAAVVVLGVIALTTGTAR